MRGTQRIALIFFVRPVAKQRYQKIDYTSFIRRIKPPLLFNIPVVLGRFHLKRHRPSCVKDIGEGSFEKAALRGRHAKIIGRQLSLETDSRNYHIWQKKWITFAKCNCKPCVLTLLKWKSPPKVIIYYNFSEVSALMKHGKFQMMVSHMFVKNIQ